LHSTFLISLSYILIFVDMIINYHRKVHFWLTTFLFVSVALPIAASLSGQPIRNVVIVGGTHGNEYTGVWCIKAIENSPLKDFPSLEISTLLGNPQAHLENKRFIHSDLNREFTEDKLTVGEEGLPLTVESLRAREVDMILGPKFGSERHRTTDVVVDLHSTTANMGTTLIIPEGDVIMAQAAAYVMHKCGGQNGEVRSLLHSMPKREHRPNLSSTARHGFTVEVGPVPQGVLRHDAVEKTQLAVSYFLEFLQMRNSGQDMMALLQKFYPNNRVPCFRSAPAKREGEISGKITWPSDPENPNFPAVMVHKSLQDRDFHIIRKGEPLFITLDGSTINYDGSHGDEVYLIFVNEGGYYYKSSGTGIGVAVASEFSLEDGKLIEHVLPLSAHTK